jgi:hypothetical protein
MKGRADMGHSRAPQAVWAGETRYRSITAAARALSLETRTRVYPTQVTLAAIDGGKIGGHGIRYDNAPHGAAPEKTEPRKDPPEKAIPRGLGRAPLLRYPRHEAPSERSRVVWR